MVITLQNNVLLGVLARGPGDLQVEFNDEANAAGLWSSTVSLLSGADRSALLLATAAQSYPRKRDAQCAAAAALMAEQAFWTAFGMTRPMHEPQGAFDSTFNYKNTLQELMQQVGWPCLAPIYF